MSTLAAIEGERWDSVCLRAYGRVTPSMVKTLRAHNRALVQTHSFALPAGAVVDLPVMESLQTQMDAIGLAPWQA